jgi:hypothetical protein
LTETEQVTLQPENGSKIKIPRTKTVEKSRLHQLGGRQQPSRGQSDETVLHPKEGGLHDVQ